MSPDPPSEDALRSRLGPEETLERSFVARDVDGAPDPALPSGESVYRFGRTGSAYVFLDLTGEFRRLPDRKVRSTGFGGTRLSRRRTVAAIAVGLCLLVFAAYTRYTFPGWSYLLRLVGWATVFGVTITRAHQRWRPRRVYRIETDAKERIEVVVPPAARESLDDSESDVTGTDGRTPDPGHDDGHTDGRRSRSRVPGRADLPDLLLGREASGALLTIATGVLVAAGWWALVLWHHPFVLGLGTWNPPGVALVLAGSGTVAVGFRANRGLLPTLFLPLAVGFGVRHYHCLAVSEFHPVSVLCPGTGLVEALSVALPLWALGVGVAVAVEGLAVGAKRAGDRLTDMDSS